MWHVRENDTIALKTSEALVSTHFFTPVEPISNVAGPCISVTGITQEREAGESATTSISGASFSA